MEIEVSFGRDERKTRREGWEGKERTILEESELQECRG